MRILLPFILFLVPCSFLFAQTDSSAHFIAGKVTVTGNKETKAWVIEREMIFNEGDSISIDDLKQSIGRIESIQLFNRVEYKLIPIKDSAVKNIEITVSESLYHLPYIYFIPVPIFKTNGGHLSQYSYGLGGIDRNFRGNAEMIYVGGWIGYSPGFEIYYENPWIGSKDNRWFLAVSAMKNDFINRSKNYGNFTEKQAGIGILVKKYLSPFHYLGVGIDAKSIQIPTVPGYFTEYEDTYFAPYLEASYDSRDFSLYAHKGLFMKYKLQKNGVSDSDVDNINLVMENKYFFKLAERTAIGVQSYHNITFGNQPLYQRKYIGFEQRVRGYYESNRESKNQMLNSLEFRFPITDVYYFDAGYSEKVVGDAGKNIKFGLSGTVFADQANLWEKPRDINLNNSISGYGFGINMLVPYFEAIRFELAWDDHGKYEGIFAAGISF